jgi:hypothetical protein
MTTTINCPYCGGILDKSHAWPPEKALIFRDYFCCPLAMNAISHIELVKLILTFNERQTKN